MQTESPIPGTVLGWFTAAQSDPQGAALPDRIGAELRGGVAPLLLLRGMQGFAARLGAPGDLSALLAMDAVWDFLPIWEGEVEPLLRAAASYLVRFMIHTRPRELHPEWLERAPLLAGPVYGGSLDPVLEAATLEEAGSGIARLLSVIQNEEYFHELLLEAAARDWTAPGWALSGTNAAVRALTGRSWKEGREIVFRVVETLHGASVASPGALPRGEIPGLPIARCFLLAAREARDLTGACQYLAHAFQAERACPLKRRQVRAAVLQSLQAWFPGLASSPADWRPAAGEEGDPDPLFRPISGACLPALQAGDPRPLLLANGARWGAHLLKRDRDELMVRVAREVGA